MLKELNNLIFAPDEKETFKLVATFKDGSVTVTIINETGEGLLKNPFNISGPIAEVDAIFVERYSIFMNKRQVANTGIVDNADDTVEAKTTTKPATKAATGSKKKTTKPPPPAGSTLDLKEKEEDDDDDDNTGEEEVVETAPVVKAAPIPPAPTPAELVTSYVAGLNKKAKEQYDKIIERIKLMKNQPNPDVDVIDFLRDNLIKLLGANALNADQVELVISLTCPKPPDADKRFEGTEVNIPEPAPWEQATVVQTPVVAAPVIAPEAKAPIPEPVIQAPVIPTPAPIIAPPKQDPVAEQVPAPVPAPVPGGMNISKDLLF